MQIISKERCRTTKASEVSEMLKSLPVDDKTALSVPKEESNYVRVQISALNKFTKMRFETEKDKDSGGILVRRIK